MPSPYNEEKIPYSIALMNSYNRLAPSDVQQAALTGRVALLALFDTIKATYNGADQREYDRWKIDADLCVQALGITDANIAADNTANAFRDRIITFNAGLTRSFFSGQHLQV